MHMNQISRRKFMEKAAIYTGGAAALAHTAGNVSGTPLGLPIGVQVWPMRTMLHDFPAFVKMVADIGVTRLELCSPVGYGAEFAGLKDAKEVVRVMSDHGIKCESSHFSMDEVRHKHQQSIDWAKEVGITQIITATLGGGNHPTLDQVKRAADEYNKIAAVSAAAGLQQGLHNEGFELSMVDGKRTYDLLLDLLDPKLVKYQFQMSTITAGFVAAECFTRYPGRFYSMHLQDINMKAPADEGASPGQRHPQVAMGRGSIDWIKTFTAAKI